MGYLAMRKVETCFSEDLEFTADVVEALYGSNMFVCAAYQLLKGESTSEANGDGSILCTDRRVGSVSLYEIVGSESPLAPSSSATGCPLGPVTVALVHRLPSDGILDAKWLNRSDEEPTLALADSDGFASFFRLRKSQLSPTCRASVEGAGMALSIDWVKGNQGVHAVCSYTSGEIAMVDLNGGDARAVCRGKAHDFEAWTSACDFHDHQAVYSGGDDCLLKLWDLRAGFAKPSHVCKEFLMGVCSLQGNALREHVFAAGSYDEKIIVWDRRQMAAPLSRADAGGGVWRLKWHPVSQDLLLAACMHNGFKIFQYDPAFSVAKPVASYDEHSSLAYGADWSCVPVADVRAKVNEDALKRCFVASCSFYDRSLKVWSVL